jgi:hypothetical protein
MRKVKKKKKTGKQKKAPQRINLKPQELEALLKRVKQAVEEEDYELIKAMAETLGYLSEAVQDKTTSIKRLLKAIFGDDTEKTKKVLEKVTESDTQEQEQQKEEAPQNKTKANGHGRNGADEYTGATKVIVRHKTLQPGDRCPECENGRVYEQKTPEKIVRITGVSPLQATVYELQRLRCNMCGVVFKADAPEEIGEEKYDAKSRSMIALLKYGSGFPFNRLEKLQGNLGVPLAASTQWGEVEGAAETIYPAHHELIRQAAQGEVLHHDDTSIKIQQMLKERQEGERRGMFTTGVVSEVDRWKIALFFSGGNHAGENMGAVLKEREEDCPIPILMCDALSRNVPKEIVHIMAHCMAHGRRNFVDVVESFPEECTYILKALEKVYTHDAHTKKHNLGPEERLQYHREHSGPVMDELKKWMQEQFDEKKVEENSGLGKAIRYMLKHWEALTLFLRDGRAPLDNNICERALKKAILHRKNSLFYKTNRGAAVGDLYMSLIHTCELNGINAFEYLTALQENSPAVFAHPENWLPWNYKDALPT